MSLEQLSRQLLSDAKKEANAVILRAEKEKERILSEAEEEKKQVLAQARKKAQELSERQKMEIISAASIRAKQIIDGEKNAAVEKALVVVFGEMCLAGNSRQYEKLLKKLAEEGQKELGKDSIIIVNEKDHAAAKKLFASVSKESAPISGGAIVSTRDGRIRVDNSFEAIFEQNKDALKRDVFLELFTEKGKK
ncbi:MAG: V-type ATP synthase subunit E [archaeon]|nr:V-type ATP synthase subunit E [archaeon]